jgi:hypothetical protein
LRFYVSKRFRFCLSARRVLRRIQNYRGTLDCVFHGESKKNAGEAAFPAARAAVSSRRTKGVLRPRGKRETRFARERRDSEESRLRACFFIRRGSTSRGTFREPAVTFASPRARARGGKEPSIFSAVTHRSSTSRVSSTRETRKRNPAQPPNRDAEAGRALLFKKEFLLVLVSRPVSAGH